MFDFAFGDEVGHRTDSFLDRHGRVDAMLVIEIKAIDAEALQGSFNRRLRICA